MTEMGERKVRLARLLAEGAVVVVSILIAFALDAWWDDRQLQKEMAEDLAIVEYELTENLRLVELTIKIMEQVTASSDEIVSILKANPHGNLVEIGGSTLFWGIFASPTLDPSLGGIDAWIAAGRLAGIQSIELRQRLASLRGKVSDVTEEQIVARDMLTEEIYPLVRHEIGDIDILKQLFASGYGARFGSTVQEVPDVGTISVPNSGALQFSLQARTAWIHAATQEMKDFQSELEEIQSLLRQEMTD